MDEALGGEGSRSAAQLPAIDGRILQLFATMETNSRYRQGPNREPLRQHEVQFKVRRRFVCFDRRIYLLIFISIIFLWQSCLASTHRPPLSSDILLRRLLDLTEDAASTRAEFARRSMEIPPAVQPSSRERRQVVRAVAVVMAMKPSVANKDVRQASGRRVLSESRPQNEESPLP